MARFNPRPAQSSGATWRSVEDARERTVSIRAPLSRAGRPGRMNSELAYQGFNPRPAQSSGATSYSGVIMLLRIWFQSAPRSVERGDCLRCPRLRGLSRFNPRPAQSSGATLDAGRTSLAYDVSIRAPLSRAGRPSHEPNPGNVLVSIRAPLSRAGRHRVADDPVQHTPRFNPRPAQSSGATCGRQCVDELRWRFNPRPAQSSGATAQHADRDVTNVSFNPRPAQSSGATRRIRDVADRVLRVSIRAPLSRAGRLASAYSTSRRAGLQFQSAPRSVERGDAWRNRVGPPFSHRFNPRPAQSSGATCRGSPRSRTDQVSIRAPLSRAGRPAARRGAGLGVAGFNPRPAQSSGATRDGRLRIGSDECVSIRAPLSRAGRRVTAIALSTIWRVSIRAPLSRAGRRRIDRHRFAIVGRVSIRAPLSRAGRPACWRHATRP